ncbi:MAG: restriction endonuclease subunit S [Bacteroidota bacterium]
MIVWKTADVGEVVSIIKGRKPNIVSYMMNEETPHNYVTIEAFEFGVAVQFASQDKNSIVTDVGDVLIVWDGARFGMVGKSIGGVLGSTLAHLKPDKILDKNYLYYFLLLKNLYLRSNQRGAGIPHLDSHLVRKLSIPLPFSCGRK